MSRTRSEVGAALPGRPTCGYTQAMVETRCPNRPALPVGKIVCVGRNFAEHAKEMGASRPAEPILFLKPSTALAGPGEIRRPPWTEDLHHEVELVVRMGRGGAGLSAADAASAVDAYGVGLDLTARDVQQKAKAAGLPWAVAKGFDGSAPVSDWIPVDTAEDLRGMEISLWVDGDMRQKGQVAQMIFGIRELIAFISSRFRLEPGDLIFTGTPEGVGPLRDGSRYEARAGAASLTGWVTA